MDISHARTFLSIAETGSFLAAAARLNITQSTVSARIRSLELEVGQSLFDRGRAGARLTAAGRRFLAYAANMTRLWEQARQELALPQNARGAVAVAGQISLWDRLLPAFLAWMRDTAPDIALRIEVGSAQEVMYRLAQGLVGVGILYTPQTRPGFSVEHLFDDELVLARAGTGEAGPGKPSYVFVDWGPDFLAAHGEAWPDSPAPSVAVEIGALGLQCVLDRGGSGYFPRRIIEPLIAAGRIAVEETAPSFRRAAWIVRDAEANDDAIGTALDGLRAVARAQAAG
ncbi:MAG: LysR family transcriptional regulator [Alphaproteobacteria bacterium]|nr:LysR family transcriptional regulator [Alphaproteobacteria bacterium]